MSILDGLEKLNIEGQMDHSSYGMIRAISTAAIELHNRLVHQDLGNYKELNSVNSSGDTQTEQDTTAHELIKSAIARVDEIGLFASEECVEPVRLGHGAISVSVDPFDGSKAFKYGIPAGTIFCLFLNCKDTPDFNGGNAFASGFFIYSMNIELVICVGGGVFYLKGNDCTAIKKIDISEQFYSVNLSNIRNWSEPWRQYFEKRLLSPNASEVHNTRWFGSLVTHAKTVLLSGGIFAYPSDERDGYNSGHLRLVYEAIPISLIFENVGGASSSGINRILDVPVRNIHDKTPLVFGEKAIVMELEKEIRRYQHMS